MDAEYTLYNGDCLEYMRTLAAGSVDAVVTDPPYSSGGAFRQDRAGSSGDKYIEKNGINALRLPDLVGDTRDALGFAYWAYLWGAQSYRALKVGGVAMFFSDWRQLPNMTNIFQAVGFVWRGVAVWDKKTTARPMSGRFTHQAEYVVWGSKGPLGWDFMSSAIAGVFQCNTLPAMGRNHQTEKPEAVMRWILEITRPGDVVLDPFMGSGTTGVACMQLGRRFIGCEIDPTYFEKAQKRIGEAASQPKLLTVEPARQPAAQQAVMV